DVHVGERTLRQDVALGVAGLYLERVRAEQQVERDLGGGRGQDDRHGAALVRHLVAVGVEVHAVHAPVDLQLGLRHAGGAADGVDGRALRGELLGARGGADVD